MEKPFFITCEICSFAGSIPSIINDITRKADMEIAPYSNGIDEAFIRDFLQKLEIEESSLL